MTPIFIRGGSSAHRFDSLTLADELVYASAAQAALEYPPNPEEEPAAAIIADGACEFDGPEYRVHDNADRTVNGKIRWFWSREPVCRSSLSRIVR